MKIKKIATCLFLPIILFACSAKDHSDELKRIDSLLAQDSVEAAIVSIRKIDVKSLRDEDDYNYYNLLSVQIASRNYNPISKCTIDSCVRYYEKVFDTRLLAEAYYYKAGDLYDNGNVAEGIHYFKKAEKLIGKASPNLQYKVWSSLAYCNFESENYQLSLDYAKKCSFASEQMKSPSGYLFSKFSEYICYGKLDKKDSAGICLKQFLPYIEYCKDGDKSGYYAEVSAYYLRTNDTLRASRYLQKALSLGCDPKVCGIAGMYYLKKRDYDKAEYMYKQKLKRSTKIDHTIAAYHGLGQVMLAKNKHEEAAFYFKKEVEYMDSLAEKNKVEGTKDIQYKFDNDEVEERTTKNNLLAICICSCLCFLFIVAIIALVVMKRRKDKELLKAKADFTEYAEEIATLRKLNGDNKKELERLTKEMKKSMSDYIRSLSKGRRIYEGLALGKFVEKRDARAMEDVMAYYRIVDADFYKMLESSYDRLTTQNRLILMLQHLGKSDEEIADILCISKGSMRSYLSRIRACKKQ